ncbi:MAG: Lrp/AsnC family transcriptional regulator [Anaerolineae bacterium]|jgi:Lrp/AsnC family transcriptional regulator, leucine-responsive regulatory protein|nr:Lrp/AsnC family transcriptional regulator [Anaerolineae bacterium]MBT7191374.1 Lrp/AsnC family transcriptional regulator [Anaerolineae bacterium]MBT7991787.1 Lrp/AsnC family transcriptional regulator [Anaerolineae bacterium]
MLDELDKNILQVLQKDARISNTELARRVNLSPPATHTRVRRLEKHGLIQNYATIVDRKKAGYDLLCFVSISLQLHDTEQVAGFIKIITGMPEVLECHHVTGEHDYLLKVVTRNAEDLEDFLMNRLTPVSGVARIHTSLVLREAKSTSEIPLE